MGNLVAMEQDHRWFENSDVGHDEGRAPLASFAIHYRKNMPIELLRFYLSTRRRFATEEGADIGRSLS